MVRKSLQRREGLDWTQQAARWGFSVSRGVEHKWIDSLLRGHEVLRLVAQDTGCHQTLGQVWVGGQGAEIWKIDRV